jgi:hypothetical protein
MDQPPRKLSCNRRFSLTVILVLCLACIAITTDAATSGQGTPVPTTISAFQLQPTIELVTPTPQTVTCLAPCRCMDRTAAIAAWGADGFTQCAELSCASGRSATGTPIEEYCFRQKAVTTTIVQYRQVPETTTPLPIRQDILVATTPELMKPVTIPVLTLDSDGDNIPDNKDNCPSVANTNQADTEPKQKVCSQQLSQSAGEGTSCTIVGPGDGIGDTCDNCPKTYNPDQKDGDNDGVGDACDLCPAKPAPLGGKEEESSESEWGDSDKDGIGNNCDNCPDTPNPDQLDSDAQKQCSVQTANQGGGITCTITKTDGRGDACDNCPLVFNDDQKDIDKDGIGDACDNCPTVSNADQKDSNKNNVGDACDCSDGISGPSDYAPDKGIYCPVITSCPHCNSKVKPIYLTDDPGKSIDIVFIPSSTSYSNQNKKSVKSQEYISSEETFRAVATDAVTNWYWKLDTLASEPIIPDYRERFNFYYYWDPLDTGDAMGSCSGVTPKNFWTNAPFTDVAAILYPPTWEKASDGFYYTYAGGCANKLGPTKSTFKAPGYVSHGAVVVHESGHAVFGLGDTYCGNTYYGYIDPKANVWPLKEWCETDVKNQGLSKTNCRQISYDDPVTTANPDCSKDFWKWDPDPDMMNQHFQGKFGPRGVGRINFIFNEYT